MTPIRLAIAALVALHLADTAMTAAALGRGAHEIGTVALPALTAFGIAGLVALGLVGAGLQLGVLRVMPRQLRSVGWVVVLSMAAFPLVWNVATIEGAA